MVDIKMSAKKEKELETLIQAARIFSQDIGMEFIIDKCTMLIIRRLKQYMSVSIELPNQDKIRTIGEKETYKHF